MKKLVLLASVFALILSSCTQDLPVADTNSEQEVIFTSNDLKGLKADLFDCDNAQPEYALVYLLDDQGDPITIVDYPLNVPVFYVNDVMYTQAIKLPAGEAGITYTVEKFELYDGDDNMVNAVPLAGSEYGEMVSVTLPLDITVSPFTKTEVPLSILCYVEEDYEAFGFTWFRINEEKITNKYFFGDFCTKFFEDYAGSPYDGMIAVDMPAIFELTLSEWNGSDWDQLIVVDNLIEDGETGTNGQLIELIYPNDLVDDGDLFKLHIRILVKVGDGFEFVDFGDWFFEDDNEEMFTDAGLTTGQFTNGEDGVYDFILGNCNVNGADFVFPPYMNLPGGAISMQLAFPATDSYFTATLSGIGTGFDIQNGTWEAYCFDLAHTIDGNGTFSVQVYSSLYVSNLPTYMQNENWGAVNWLANNYADFNGTWQDLQIALWMIEENGTSTYAGGEFHGLTGTKAIVDAMVAGALANSDFMPMPGGWAAVVLEHSEGTQTIFTIVDP